MFSILYRNNPAYSLVVDVHPTSVPFPLASFAIEVKPFKRRIKSHLPFAGIIKSSPYSLRWQDKG